MVHIKRQKSFKKKSLISCAVEAQSRETAGDPYKETTESELRQWPWGPWRGDKVEKRQREQRNWSVVWNGSCQLVP